MKKLISKYHNMSVQVKAALWYTICNFLQKGIAFIVVPIYAHLLTTEEYGRWVVFQSWRDILIIFASLNLYCGVYTKKLVDMQENKDQYTSAMQGLGTVITAVMLVVYFIAHKWINAYLGYDIGVMVLLFLFFLAFPALQFWSTRQRVEYKYHKMVVVTVCISVLTPLVSILLLKKTDLRANAIIYGYLIVQCAFGIVFYVMQFIRGKVFYNAEYWKYGWDFNIPLIPHYLSLIVLGQADRIMIRDMCGESDAGIYGLAYQIASAISVLISAINGSRVPWTYEQLRDKQYDNLKKISNLLCVMMGGITVFVSLLSPEVIRFMTPDAYDMAIYVIPLVVVGVYFTFCYDLFCGVEFYYGATKFVMIASCIGAILNVILNAIFLPIFGFIAAACTTLFCYLIFMLMHYVFMRKVAAQQKITDPIYDNRFIFLFSAIVLVLSLGCMLLYQVVLVRILLLLFVMIAVWMKRNVVLGAIKEMRKR